MNSTHDTTTRRHLLTSSLVKSLAIALLPTALLGQNVAADKKKKKKGPPTVSERTQSQREMCETLGGGKMAVLDGPNGGNTTECKGGDSDGFTCINTKKDTKCHQALTQPTSSLNDSTAPTTGGNEQPYDGGKPAGGGAGVDPGPAEDPGGSGTDPVILLAGRQVSVAAEINQGGKGRRNGKRGRRGHSRQR